MWLKNIKQFEDVQYGISGELALISVLDNFYLGKLFHFNLIKIIILVVTFGVAILCAYIIFNKIVTEFQPVFIFYSD